MNTSNPTSTCLIEEPLTKTEALEHQARAIELSKDRPYFGLLMEQGTGKTFVTIATFTHLFRRSEIDGVLILAPNGVHDNWVLNEIPKHCALRPDEMLIACWHGTDGLRKRAWWDFAATTKQDNVLTVLAANIEAVRTVTFCKSISKFVAHRRFLLVVDESTTIKNPKADQSKMVHKIAGFAKYRRILTGTPITQSPLDLWSQCRALSPDALPYQSYTAFKHTFAIEQAVQMGHRSFNKIIGYRNQDLLAELLSKFTLRVLKKDCLDLPDKIYQKRYIELTAEQRRIYKDLMRTCLAEVGDGTVSVTHAITMLLRLHQVTLGYVTGDDKVLRPIEHNRIAALLDHIDLNPGKTIIFCRFRQDIAQVCEALPENSYAPYTGEETSGERNLAVDQFQNDPRIRFFVATDAAARGLTLTAAEQVVYYSQGFSLETRLQSEDRAHRIGQQKNVLYTDFVAKGTIDERVIDALRAKKELASQVLDRAALVQLMSIEE